MTFLTQPKMLRKSCFHFTLQCFWKVEKLRKCLRKLRILTFSERVQIPPPASPQQRSNPLTHHLGSIVVCVNQRDVPLELLAEGRHVDTFITSFTLGEDCTQFRQKMVETRHRHCHFSELAGEGRVFAALDGQLSFQVTAFSELALQRTLASPQRHQVLLDGGCDRALNFDRHRRRWLRLQRQLSKALPCRAHLRRRRFGC